MADFMRDYIEKIKAKDWAGAAAYFADHITFHQSGTGAYSGTRSGKEEVLSWMGEITASTDSMEIEAHALTEGDGHAVAITTFSATKGDASFSGKRVVVYHLGDNVITELWAIDEDQAGMDAFMAL